jgi:hypothetical protein
MERPTLSINPLALKLLLAVALVATWLAASPLVAQQTPIPQETLNFMRAKLQHSHKIMEGLATENYDLVVKHAQEMSLLSLESQWNVLRTQRYVDESAEFRHSIARLMDAAKTKSIDSTALGYVDVTLKCVHCHTYVRNRGAREAIGQNQNRSSTDTGALGRANIATPARTNR